MSHLSFWQIFLSSVGLGIGLSLAKLHNDRYGPNRRQGAAILAGMVVLFAGVAVALATI